MSHSVPRETPKRHLTYQEIMTELGSPPEYQSTVGDAPTLHERICLWDRDAYLQRAQQLALAPPSPHHSLDIDFQSQSYNYQLLAYPSSAPSLQGGRGQIVVPSEFGESIQSANHPTYNEVVDYNTICLKPLKDNVDLLFDFVGKSSEILLSLRATCEANENCHGAGLYVWYFAKGG